MPPGAPQIRFCTSPDGTRIAYATSGSGPPLVRAAHWISHLKFDWDSPVWRHWLAALAHQRSLIHYDARGCGLSDREDVEFSLDKHVEDLETVVDKVGLDQFALFGMAGGGIIAVNYAVRHPERVTHLVLHGVPAVSKITRGDAAGRAEIAAFEVGWGKDNPAFRQLFTSQLLPDGTAEQFRAFNDLIRLTTTPANAARILRVFYQADLREVAPHVRCPCLIAHAREDGRVTFEQGRELASLIPGARFVPLESRNHVLLENEPAWQQFVQELNDFLPRSKPEDGAKLIGDLTAREHAVLELVAQGLDNDSIGARLGIGEKTVRNYVSIILSKLGVSTRARAIVRAREAGLGREV
jgi:pimeloyl-ACP methyl ester carboxylesterase/DNA-binding CsgD family transcriptional regulator